MRGRAPTSSSPENRGGWQAARYHRVDVVVAIGHLPLQARGQLLRAAARCGTGECGSCTVLLDGEPILACLMLAVECRNKNITTIEGLADGRGMTPVQEAYLEKGGVQCGFCTPGMVLATTALLNRNPKPSEEDINRALEGHLCRCTGYNKILEAVHTAADKKPAVYHEELVK